MLNVKRVLGIATAAVFAAGLAGAEGLPGLGAPPAAPATPGAAAPGGTVELQIVKNGEDGYQLGYPTGWGIVTGGDNDYTFGPTDGSLHGFCFANGNSAPNLPPDDQIKPILSTPIGEDNWKSFMFEGLPDLKFVSTGVDLNHAGDWPYQNAIVTATVDNTPVEIAAQMTLKGKTSFGVACVFTTTDFEKATPLLKAIFQSFKVNK